MMSLILPHLQPFLHLRSLWQLATLILLTATAQLHAQSQAYAKGIVIYIAPGDTLQDARASLYRSYTHAQPTSSFDIGSGTPLVIENSVVLEMLDLGPHLLGNIATPADRQGMASFISSLQAIVQKYPKTSPVCSSVVKVIQSNLDRYDKGEVRLNGQWESQETYQKRVTAIQQTYLEEMALAIMQRQKAQDMQSHLSGTYRPQVVSLMQKDYEGYMGYVTRFLERQQGAEIGLGPMDPRLYERSRLIPPPSGAHEAGIYSSGTENGPAIIWIIRDKTIISMMVGFTLLTDPESSQILNQQELTQAQTFLDRIEPGLLDCLPTMLAANKIQRVLRKTETIKSVTSDKVELDVAVHSPQVLPNGDTLQHVIFYLF